MKTKHIKQKGKWDCCIASIAMMVGEDYAVVLLAYEKLYPNHKKKGLSDDEILKLLKAFKCRPKIIDAVIKNISGLMFLPSKNENGSHAVYFNGREILDPNYKVPGKKYYQKKLPKKFPDGTQMVVNTKDEETKLVLKELKKLIK